MKPKKPIVLHCRACGHELERAASKKPFWHCINLFCEKNQKKPVRIGDVIVTNKPKGR